MWYNGFMNWLLRSPLHGLISGGTMLLTVTGRKSGRSITTPVNYVRDGDVLWATSFRQRKWWRNLKAGAPVGVLLAGQELKGRGEAIVERPAVAESLLAFLSKVPKRAKYFGVGLDASGKPLFADCERAADDRVMVRIELAQAGI